MGTSMTRLSALMATRAALALSLILATAPAMAADCVLEKPTLKTAAEQSGILVQMTAATKLAGLDEADPGIGPLTLFAPSDEAFNALPEALRTKLLAPENRGQLAIVLMHHAIPGEYSTQRLLNASARHYAVDAVDGSLVEITTRRGLDVAGAKIIKPDIVASNGIIPIIDKVLIPAAVLAELDGQPAITEVAGAIPAE
jgi:uncharacterized surface protein with fasciclin (FAS1) repeats